MSEHPSAKSPVLSLDQDACTGCMTCMVACSLKKEKSSSLKHARIWILKTESASLNIPVICEQCDPAPCSSACPTGAIVRKAGTEVLVVNRDRCIGCKECIWACPFGAMFLQKSVAVKCDLCDGKPECARVCLPGALKYASLDRSIAEKKWGYHDTRMQPPINQG